MITSMNDNKPITPYTPAQHDRALHSSDYTALGDAGQTANRIAGDTIFQRYLSEKSPNTIKRHARDLELFAEYMLDIGIMPDQGADFQTNPQAWQGVTWGIVEGFIHWQLREGYAISSVNARLSTVKVYAQMAVKAATIERQEGLLIQSVKGFSRAGGHNVDLQRDQTRINEVSYAYKLEGKKSSVVVTRRSTKKQLAAVLDEETAVILKQPQNKSPQAYRDALLMCLLLDHGLRASEVAMLTIDNIDLRLSELQFFRPKVKGTSHEWTVHKMTDDLYTVSRYYLKTLYPPTLHPDGALLLTTTRLRKDGQGGLLQDRGLNRVRLSERVAYLGKNAGLSEKLSAHDCRHYCATQMARLGYGVDELMAWFGWTSAQTAMRYITAVDVKERYKG